MHRRDHSAHRGARIFDSHLHIIPAGYPLYENNGFLPDCFSVADYRTALEAYDVQGGVVVSGSFQKQDQSYLLDSLHKLGEGFFGVTQLRFSASDEDIIALNCAGVRGVRFNLMRGGSETVENLASFAARVYELVKWHVELYIDAREIEPLYDTLVALPSVSIDHLGLSKAGLPWVIKLAERGVKVKATGFGRVNFDPRQALSAIYDANPASLMFGTDLPGTRAPKPFCANDIAVIQETLGETAANRVLCDNAVAFYNR
uniref:amidohydrolase family protein n=1 Tax=Microbulbifer agarilyticus TaxID=260552 RepID=UPI000255BC0A|nr:amidohydrolase family protein [Microbulbifer agarilyticus]